MHIINLANNYNRLIIDKCHGSKKKGREKTGSVYNNAMVGYSGPYCPSATIWVEKRSRSLWVDQRSMDNTASPPVAGISNAGSKKNTTGFVHAYHAATPLFPDLETFSSGDQLE
jgi:hypothetical protein